MPIFAVTYSYDATEDQLAAVRAEHREYLAGLPELVLSGPWVGAEPGALLVLEAPDAAALGVLVAADPFVRDGLVGTHTVREWNPVLGRVLGEL